LKCRICSSSICEGLLVFNQKDFVMGKITLAVLVILIGFAAYWFYWEESGANAPMTINYNLSFTAVEKQGNSFIKWDVSGDLDFYATPDKAKIEANFDFKKQNKKIANIKIAGILRLDTKKIYLMLPDSKEYCEKEFDFVPLSETEKTSSDKSQWLENFALMPDSEWFGSENEKYYARKQVPKSKSWENFKKMNPDAKIEFWFTDDSKLGNRYIKGLNKLIRIDMDLEKEMGNMAKGKSSTKTKAKSSNSKRPLMARQDLPYFPLPMKIFIDAKDPKTKAPGRITIIADKFSRAKIEKSEFEVPKDFKKITVEKFGEEVMKKVLPLIMSQMIK
jgi:hypothetical protein